MDRTQLLTGIGDRLPVPGEAVYLQRPGGPVRLVVSRSGPLPQTPGVQGGEAEAWLFFSGAWPHEPGRLAEMEPMWGTQDRGRWPLDQPYPRAH